MFFNTSGGHEFVPHPGQSLTASRCMICSRICHYIQLNASTNIRRKIIKKLPYLHFIIHSDEREQLAPVRTSISDCLYALKGGTVVSHIHKDLVKSIMARQTLSVTRILWNLSICVCQ